MKRVHPMCLSLSNIQNSSNIYLQKLIEYSYHHLSRQILSILDTTSPGWCWMFNVSTDKFLSTLGSACKCQSYRSELLHLLLAPNMTPLKHLHLHSCVKTIVNCARPSLSPHLKHLYFDLSPPFEFPSFPLLPLLPLETFKNSPLSLKLN